MDDSEHADTDVLIIGGGAIGICSAYYLWKAGQTVTVIERKEKVGAGSSEKNAGLIAPSHIIPLASPKVIKKGLRWLLNPNSPFYIKPQLSKELLSWFWKFWKSSTKAHQQRSIPILRDLNLTSLELLKEMQMEESFDFGFKQDGLLMLYNTYRGFEEGLTTAQLARDAGLQVEIFNHSDFHQIETNLQLKAKGGIYYSQNGHLDPAQFVTRLAEFLQQNGVGIFTSIRMTGFERKIGQITGVNTTQGRFSAKEVVLAGGVWSAEILSELSLKLPMQAAKGYSITLPAPPGKPHLPMILAESKVAVTPLEDSLRFAGTLEFSGLNEAINQRRVKAILRAIPNYFANFHPQPDDQTQIWSGLRPCSPDGLPFLGRYKQLKNLIVATGHAMIGISLAPVTGKLVSELVMNETPSLDLSALNVERFN